jgi:hypothetical protein
MKRAGFFLLLSFVFCCGKMNAQSCRFNSCAAPAYFQPHTFQYNTFSSFNFRYAFPQRPSFYFQPTFSPHYQYRLPQAAVFCRMENYTRNKYNVMLSIHAGGYHE